MDILVEVSLDLVESEAVRLRRFVLCRKLCRLNWNFRSPCLSFVNNSATT